MYIMLAGCILLKAFSYIKGGRFTTRYQCSNYNNSVHTDRTIQITEGPKTIYNATINDEVFFSCQVEGTEESPSWNINGQDFFVTELPPKFSFRQGRLIVKVTTMKLNGSVLYCFYDLSPSGMIKSQPASLFIINVTKGLQSNVGFMFEIIIRFNM